MIQKKNSSLRWILIPIYIGMMVALIGCAAAGTGSSNMAQGLLQLENGIVNIRNQKGELQPLAGGSTFDLVGTLESVDPWKVSGRTLQRNDATQIAQGLEVGDLVRVRGAVMEDDNWLAYSIEPVEEQPDQSKTVILIGTVTSTDPWVVNGIDLNVTGDTVVNGEINAGTLVRVEAVVLEDWTWDVISITPLQDSVPTTSGCVTVTATVESVNGDQIKFLGWPTSVTVNGNSSTSTENYGNYDDYDGVDVSTLQPGQQVLAVLCLSGNGQVVVTKITVLDDETNDADGGEKVLVCHKPDKKGGHTISIAAAAVPAHMAHGDKMGACP